MSYSVQNIRNVCLLGHGGNGKTSLAESMLYLTGGTVRLGNPADGNTVCDYDPEETRRQISISTAVAPVEYNGCKINVLDTPGYFDFSGEVIEALQVADAAIIVCSAKAGMSVGAEKAWKLCEQRRLPRLLYISKTDEENSDYNAAFDTLRERFGKNIAPVAAPIWDADKKVIGFIDVLHKRAFEAGPKGERIEIDVPDDKKPVLDELYDALKESVAETSEELMDKYFSGEDFTYAEMIQGLRQGVKDLSLFPVVCGSAVSGLGTRMLLDIIVELLPSPLEGRPLMGENADGEVDEFVPFPGALPAALVWKTVSDQYGKYSFVKVISGNLKPDMQLVNSRTGATEKLGRLYVMKGKKAEEVKELECGDIGAIGKMEKVKTGDTLSDPRKVVKLEPIPFPEPCYSVAITPKTKGQEDKIAAGLIRLNEEDLTFNWVNNAETRQMVVSGTGDMQMDVILSRLKSRFGVDAELSEPRVPYREKIRKKVEVQGRHKKQTGGHGQFGDVWMRFEPGDTEELQFCEEVVGGAVPKNYFPAVEKGMREAVVHGVLAGYPVVYLKATLYDGSYHPVDSSEMAFKTAAQLAYKAALAQAEGTLMQNQAQLKNAEIDLQRYKGLYAEDSIAKQTLDTQEAQVRQLQGTIRTNQGQVDDARLNLTFTEVRAPISGRLGLRQVDIGNLVTSGDTTPLVVITQVKPISVVFSLPQQQIGTVVEQMNGPGKLAVTALDRNQDKVLAEGTLTTLDNQIDTTTGTVKLKARFENADGKLFPNQFVNVRLLAQTLKGVLTIPANAVQRGTNGIYVYVVGADNKVSQRSVAIGTSENERVVVESGLKAGEQVVVEGTDRLRDGMEVRVAEASPQVLEGDPQKPQTGRPSGLQGDSVGSGSAE